MGQAWRDGGRGGGDVLPSTYVTFCHSRVRKVWRRGGERYVHRKSFSEDNTMRLAATLTRALPITLLNLILTLSSQSCSIPLHSNAKFLLCTYEGIPFIQQKKSSNLQTLAGVKQLAKRITLIRCSTLTWYLKIRNIIFSLRFFCQSQFWGNCISFLFSFLL